MLVLLHIAIGLMSLVTTTATLLFPSRQKLNACYVLIGLTVASGTYLVISTHSRLAPACEAGLFYLGINLAGIIIARYRLQTTPTKS